MAVPNKIRIGSSITTYPAGTHNWLVDNVGALVGRRSVAGMISEAQAAKRPPRIKNTTGETISNSFGVVKLDAPLEDVEAGPCESHRGVRFKGAAPVQGEEFAILQAAAAPDQYVKAVVAGETWCDVDIQDEGHKTAGVINGDSAKLQSGKTGAQILWKPPGTGVKRALVSLGGAAVVSSEVGLAVTDTQVEAMIVGLTTDPVGGSVTLGSGTAYELIDGGAPVFDVGGSFTVYNATTSLVPRRKVVQWKTIAGIRVIDAEDCS